MNLRLKPDDSCYWLNLTSLDDWESGRILISQSVVESWYEPTQMIVTTKGKYLRPEDCYSSVGAAKAALREWIEVQRQKLDEIEDELDFHV
jgi:hypothetical protein